MTEVRFYECGIEATEMFSSDLINNIKVGEHFEKKKKKKTAKGIAAKDMSCGTCDFLSQI